ncbi:MAG: hypothetical protein ACK4K0_12810 [Flavobacteriales bacterium]
MQVINIIYTYLTSPRSHGLVLFFTALLGYWQISLFYGVLPWDLIDCYYPWRYFVAESIQQGEIPLWNPFQHLGFPIHADMRSSVWNPEFWFIGYFFGYTAYTFNALFVGYAFIGGLGFYKLFGRFNKNKTAALLGAIGYILMGFYVSRAQEISAITAAAWTPLSLYAYLKLIQQISALNIFRAALFLFFLIVNSYQTLTIGTFYLLLILFFINLISNIKRKQTKAALCFTGANLLVALLIASASVVMMWSYVQANPHVNRLSGLNFSQTEFYSFPFKAMLSLITPYATVINENYWGSFSVMTNGYMGVILLVFAFGYLFSKQKYSLWLKAILVFSLISLFVAMGKDTPVFKFFFDYVPLMNLFRFPSFLIYFFSLSLILLAALGFDYYQKNTNSFKPVITGCLTVFSGILFILISLSLWKKGHHYFPALDFSQSLLLKKEVATLSNHIFWQSTLWLAILLFLIVLIKKNNLKSSFIFAAVVLEMLIAVQLNMPYTGKSFEGSPRQLTQEILLSTSKNIPTDSRPIAEQTDQRPSLSPLWRNTSTFQQRISAEGYNSFMLNGFKSLLTEHRSLLDSMNQNGLAYFSDDIRAVSTLNSTQITKSTVFLPDSLINKLPTLKNDSTNKLSIVRKGFHKFILKTNVQYPVLLTLQQNHYPGWKALANGKEIALIKGNLNCLSVLLTPEMSELIFRYENPSMISVATFSLIGFLFILFGYSLLSLREWLGRTKEFHSGILLCGLYFFGTLFFTGKPHPTSESNKLYTLSLQTNSLIEEIEPEGFSSVLDLALDTLPRKGFVIETQFSYLDSLNNKGFFYVVTHQNDAGEVLFYKSYSAEYHKAYEKKEEVLTIKTPYYPTQKKGKMRIYFWNAGKTNATVKDVEIKIYR